MILIPFYMALMILKYINSKSQPIKKIDNTFVLSTLFVFCLYRTVVMPRNFGQRKIRTEIIPCLL